MSLGRAHLIQADVRGTLPLADKSVQCCVTSPPYYGLRDYGDPRQIGLEPTPDAYVARMVSVFREVRRVLRDDGVLWLNLGDSYVNQGGHTSLGETSQRQGRSNIDAQHTVKGVKPQGNLKTKDLIGIPWRVAFALQADGWYLRSDCIWAKPNPMPESVTDRPTKSHEYVFLLTKSPRYFYDASAERVPASPDSGWAKQRASGVNTWKYNGTPERLAATGQDVSSSTLGDGTANLRTTWTISTRSYPGAHFATFPPELPARCIRLGTSEKGACPACGAPWRRVLSKDRKPTRPGVGSKVIGLGSDAICNRDPARHVTTSSTVGWQASCSCDAGEPVPCVVLDPFSGSGTTAAVARELGRVGVGLEVNAEYLDLARDRTRRPAIGRDNPSLAPSPSAKPMEGQLEMFV